MDLFRKHRLDYSVLFDVSIRLRQFGDEPLAQAAHRGDGHDLAGTGFEINREGDTGFFRRRHFLDDDRHSERLGGDAVLAAVGQDRVGANRGAHFGHCFGQFGARHGQQRFKLPGEGSYSPILRGGRRPDGEKIAGEPGRGEAGRQRRFVRRFVRTYDEPFRDREAECFQAPEIVSLAAAHCAPHFRMAGTSPTKTYMRTVQMPEAFSMPRPVPLPRRKASAGVAQKTKAKVSSIPPLTK